MTLDAFASRRRDRYRRRATVARMARHRRSAASAAVNKTLGRVAKCGRVPAANGAEVRCVAGDSPYAYLAGVVTCSNVWLCAVCSAKIRTRRQLEVAALAEAHTATGGDLGLLTLTLRHHRWHDLAAMLRTLADAWESLRQDARWRELGIVGYVRSLEVTYSERNGWHPHYHVLLLFDGPAAHAERLDWLTAAWAERVEKRLGARPSKAHGCDFRLLPHGAASYVAKIGAEMARGDLKGSQQIWQLLDAVDDGDTRATALVLDYASATKGKRAIQFSKGLRDLYDLGPELTDDEIANADEGGELVMTLSAGELARLTRPVYGQPPAIVALLEQIEARYRGSPPRPDALLLASSG